MQAAGGEAGSSAPPVTRNCALVDRPRSQPTCHSDSVLMRWSSTDLMRIILISLWFREWFPRRDCLDLVAGPRAGNCSDMTICRSHPHASLAVCLLTLRVYVPSTSNSHPPHRRCVYQVCSQNSLSVLLFACDTHVSSYFSASLLLSHSKSRTAPSNGHLVFTVTISVTCLINRILQRRFSLDVTVDRRHMFPSFSEWMMAAESAISTSAREGTTTAKAEEHCHGEVSALPVLVIGAGPAGLAVMAELAARSTSFLCMEQSVDVGGMWDRENNPKSPVYSSLRTNVSKFSMTLGKPFDMPHHWPPYVPQQLALSYLQSFADQHRLRPHIQFGHRVHHCDFDRKAHSWRVHFTHGADGAKGSASFSDIIVATGQNSRDSAAFPAELLAQAQRFRLARSTHLCVYRRGRVP